MHPQKSVVGHLLLLPLRPGLFVGSAYKLIVLILRTIKDNFVVGPGPYRHAQL